MYGQFPNAYSGYPMQNRFGSVDQQYQQQISRQSPVQVMPLNGRIVTGVEEARASQISLDGTPSYFPSPAENKIYVKSLDMNGLPVFLVYELKLPENNNLTPGFAENSQMAELKSRVDTLESKIKEILNHESNTTSTNA